MIYFFHCFNNRPVGVSSFRTSAGVPLAMIRPPSAAEPGPTPTSVVPRSHARFIVAIVLSGLQLLAIVLGVAALIITRRSG